MSSFIEKCFFSQDDIELYESCRLSGIPLREAIPDDLPLQEKMRNQVEGAIASSVAMLSEVQYEIMRQSNDFGAAGFDIVTIGQSRICNQSVEEVLAAHTRNGFENLSLDQLRELESTWSVQFMGRRIPVERADILNEDLRLVGSRKRLAAARTDSFRSILFGECEQVTDEAGNEYYTFGENEQARTPVLAFCIPALAGPGFYLIRKNACLETAKRKWLPKVGRLLHGGGMEPAADPIETIRDEIDLATVWLFIEGFGTDRQNLLAGIGAEVEEQARLFCDGHAAFHQALGPALSALSRAIDHLSGGDTLLKGLSESIVQFAVPLRRFLGLAGTDQPKATRMTLNFISDYWYFGTPRLDGSSSFFLSCLAPAIKGKTVDFNLLQERFDAFEVNLTAIFKKNLQRMADHLSRIGYDEVKIRSARGEAQAAAPEFASRFQLSDRQEHFYISPRNNHSLQISEWLHRINYLRRTKPGEYARFAEHLHEFRQEIGAEILRLNHLDQQKVLPALQEFIMKELRAG